MSGQREIAFTLDVGRSRPQPTVSAASQPTIPRIARLLALALRLEDMVGRGTIRDYAEAARLGRVTRARMTQIMRLLHLAPDIQERILLEPPPGLKERHLRPIANLVDWDQQRRRFGILAGEEHAPGESKCASE